MRWSCPAAPRWQSLPRHALLVSLVSASLTEPSWGRGGESRHAMSCLSCQPARTPAVDLSNGPRHLTILCDGGVSVCDTLDSPNPG
ncbi:hypothetical protein F5Y16DRAFT_44002 [Xylariaceae sp. FL0255]|nr:hypothetical protein F5Y16DRAFT_44002 [Xylariaceae sp. FL0255]